MYSVGGFCVLVKRVAVEGYLNAAQDILFVETTEIVAKLNRDHASDLLLRAEHRTYIGLC